MDLSDGYDRDDLIRLIQILPNPLPSPPGGGWSTATGGTAVRSARGAGTGWAGY